MKAWTALPRLLSSLADLCGLLREQNGLLRESIRIQTGYPAQTLPYNPPAPPKRPHRIYTDADVYVRTREDLQAADRAAQEAMIAPWRTPPPSLHRPAPLPPNAPPSPMAAPPTPATPEATS